MQNKNANEKEKRSEGTPIRRRGKNKKGSKKRKRSEVQVQAQNSLDKPTDALPKLTKKKPSHKHKKQKIQKQKQPTEPRSESGSSGKAREGYVQLVATALLNGEGGNLSDRLNHTHPDFDKVPTQPNITPFSSATSLLEILGLKGFLSFYGCKGYLG